MLLNLFRVLSAFCLLLIGMQSLWAQDENAGLQYASFEDGVALAAKTGRPLLVFGIRDG